MSLAAYNQHCLDWKADSDGQRLGQYLLSKTSPLVFDLQIFNERHTSHAAAMFFSRYVKTR